GIEDAFSQIARQKSAALIVLGDGFTILHRKQIAGLATRYRVPAAYTFRDFVDEGGLLSYGASLIEMFRQSAGYVGKIFKGADPKDLPVAEPTKYDMIVNLNAAKALGLAIPQSILLRVDQAIE